MTDQTDRAGFYVYAITFDQDVFGVFSTREAAEKDLEDQIAGGGPAWDGCDVSRLRVARAPEATIEPRLDRTLDDLSRMYAYDVGDPGAGLHDELRRVEIVTELDGLDDDVLRRRLSEWVREAFLSAEALELGYGWEDVLGFLRWFD